MTRTRSTLMAAFVIAMTASPDAALAQGTHDHGSHGSALGQAHFMTSCQPEAQKLFDRALLYQHSFWYRASREGFEAVVKSDPQCAIAHWGIAVSLLGNPLGAPPAENLPRGLAAIQKAQAVGAKTQRERDFVDALAAYYADHDQRGHRVRVEAYLKAMEQVAQRYVEDDEAQIFYALALNAAVSFADKTYANQLKAAAILEEIFKRQPQHPGVAHYLIHSYDYPPIAHKGLDAARRYAAIASAAPHALHMPSHIFTRVGYWRESIASNKASAQVAKQDNEPDDRMHALDYLVYAYLQLAEDEKARGAIEEMQTVSGTNPGRMSAPYAIAASSARYMMERGDWRGAANLPVRASQYPMVDTMTYFARAVGAARSGKLDDAKADIAKLAELRDRMKPQNAYGAELADIQWHAASAWVLLGEGKQDDAITMMKAAADAEDKTEKSAITPGPLAPARELLGAMLLERGLAADALAAFEATLRKEPNRLAAAIGAARAAAKAGDAAKAAEHYGLVAKLTEGVETARTEVAEARAVVARKQ